MPIRLFDLLHGTDHVLLASIPDPSAAGQVAALATTLRARFGRHLRIYGIAADPLLADLPGLPVFLDEGGGFSQAYGSTARAAWIVRPDGYVGHRTAELREEDVLHYFEKILRPQGPVS
jgi:pentachlorophenol monooxygenase